MEKNFPWWVDIDAAANLRKSFALPVDIHRSGGQLLDNTGLTSRICGGSWCVGWIDRSLITG
jgi:hypothetical protein